MPYKKIEKLIENISAEIRLVIAGSAPDKIYIEKLHKLAAKKNIIFIPEFISNEKAANLARGSCGIVLTHNDYDMIVSGTFFYALSMGVPLYSVCTPFIDWAEKNLKVPGLYATKDIPSLCKRLETDALKTKKANVHDEEKIEHLFGDLVIESKWSEILYTPR